ncbi:MAG: elongation factor Ts [Candidatus Magasanikbacteria bacterium CG10_big_fil_rev_8_21_14_0_10_40_10]|uniref:Elongation factor Ts n=1 Tax=Candidatus Magasanikbacteria bacterium CG10_big_fil_rev_8_21_14_0_10_40_10 TaxID=1974648 RepID=A0A2M6W2W5_9BACT|nr:MAG: elongation factor Ts [Candidatus Magasanikbacteria bacterium CG10_big_fil_rev_8_21_14_0_10_40_10]
MEISTQDIQQLRESMGVGIMDAKKALLEAAGDIKNAEKILEVKGAKSAEKRASKETHEGRVGEYVHANGKEAGLVAVACETDFVALTDDFKNLAHDLALHVVAMKPKYLKPEDVPADVLAEEEQIWKKQLTEEGKPEKIFENILKGKRQKFFSEVCFLKQQYVKDDSQTIEDIMTSAITKLGENIQITGFSFLTL